MTVVAPHLAAEMQATALGNVLRTASPEDAVNSRFFRALPGFKVGLTLNL